PKLQLAGQQLSPATHMLIWDTGLVQRPFAHDVPAVQPLPSSHAMPSLVGSPPTHLPALHVSPVVQLFASSQGVPLGATTVWQEKVFSSHIPTWHLSLGGAQGLGSPVQLALWQ